MFFDNWSKWLQQSIRSVRNGRRPKGKPFVRGFRPTLESLEERVTPANYAPNILTDPDVSVNFHVRTVDGHIIANAGNVDTGNISLRSAVIAANANPGADTITLANNATYTLSLIGNDADSMMGDLDINDDLTLNGASAIIQGATDANFTNNIHDKIIGINQDGSHDSLTVDINNVTIRYGHNEVPFGDGSFAYTGGGVDVFLTGAGNAISFTNVTIDHNESVTAYGGGVNVDSLDDGSAPHGTVTFTNSIISNNKSALWGGGMNLFADNHNVVIDGTTIQNNQTTGATGDADGGGVNIRHTNGGTVTIRNGTIVSGNSTPNYGGGVNVQSTGNQTLIIQDTSITGNNAGENGGGVAIQAPFGSVTLTRATLTGNTANSDNVGGGDGGAIFRDFSVPDATVSINFSRITGNIANTGGGGTGTTGIRNVSGGTIDATNNWWGADANPGVGGTDNVSTTSGAINTSPRLDLSLTAGSTTLNVGAQTILIADFTKNSAGATISAANLAALIGQPIQFSSGSGLGSISAADATLQANGMASATYTAGATSGLDIVTATVDNAPAASTDITINSPPQVTTQPTSTTVDATQNATFTAHAATGSPTPTVQWFVQTGGAGPFTALTNVAP